MLNVICSFAYAITAILCVRSALLVHRVKGPAKSAAFWYATATFFLALIAVRLTGFEEHARSMLRAVLQADGEYSKRRGFQAPLAVAVILAIVAAIVALWVAHPAGRHRSPKSLERWALYGVLAMAGLVALRMVSLHATDALLYGALHLNWFGDLGATLMVAAAAWLHAKLLNSGVSGARRRSRGP